MVWSTFILISFKSYALSITASYLLLDRKHIFSCHETTCLINTCQQRLLNFNSNCTECKKCSSRTLNCIKCNPTIRHTVYCKIGNSHGMFGNALEPLPYSLKRFIIQSYSVPRPFRSGAGNKLARFFSSSSDLSIGCWHVINESNGWKPPNVHTLLAVRPNVNLFHSWLTHR